MKTLDLKRTKPLDLTLLIPADSEVFGPVTRGTLCIAVEGEVQLHFISSRHLPWGLESRLPEISLEEGEHCLAPDDCYVCIVSDHDLPAVCTLKEMSTSNASILSRVRRFLNGRLHSL